MTAPPMALDLALVLAATAMTGGPVPTEEARAALVVLGREVYRLRPIESAARDAYPPDRERLYFRPHAPKILALRAALYGPDPETEV